MRKDMFKVIVERPRVGYASGTPQRKYRLNQEDPENMPSNEGIKRPHRGRTKMLNENLNPLKRFLRKQVGRPWDKVYSEVCENLKTTSTVQQHVRDHIQDFVFENVTLHPEGYLEGMSKRGYARRLSPDDMYIDASGLLQVAGKHGFRWNHSKHEARPTHFPEVLAWEVNQVIDTKRSFMTVKGGQLLRAYPNPDTGNFDLLNKATVAHAKADLWRVKWDKIGRLIEANKVRMTRSGSPYMIELVRAYEHHLAESARVAQEIIDRIEREKLLREQNGNESRTG